MSKNKRSNGVDELARFLFENSIFLISGSMIAMIWANVDLDSYYQLLHTSLIPGPGELMVKHRATRVASFRRWRVGQRPEIAMTCRTQEQPRIRKYV